MKKVVIKLVSFAIYKLLWHDDKGAKMAAFVCTCVYYVYGLRLVWIFYAISGFSFSSFQLDFFLVLCAIPSASAYLILCR